MRSVIDAGVSVVIPTYNAALFIHGALNSVFAQSQPPDDCVVVDDASTDDTVGLVDRIRVESPVPIRIMRRSENAGGPALPLNAAIGLTSRELVAILEQDDVMAPSRIQ